MFFGPRTAMTYSLFCCIVIVFLLTYLSFFLPLACLCVCMIVLFFTSLFFVDLCSHCDVLCSSHCMATELATQVNVLLINMSLSLELEAKKVLKVIIN